MSQVPAVLVENLRVDYAEVTAVDGLDLSIEAGQIFGLVGPNGAGKTSTIRVLATLLEPTFGRVRVDGFDVIEQPEEARVRLGYMPDLAPVNPDLRVDEFLEFFDRSYGLPTEGRKARIDAAIAEVGLEGKRRSMAKNLSRGLTQRLVLAKTLLHQPTVLLLDEPASGMDPLARRELRDILRRQARNGCAVLISSHILTELADMCTHVGVMRQGKLRATGSVADILSLVGEGIRDLRLESVEPIPGSLEDWVEAHAQVREWESQGHSMRVRFEGDDRAVSEFLRELIESGYPIFRCEPTRPALEDVLTSLSDEKSGSDSSNATDTAKTEEAKG